MTTSSPSSARLRQSRYCKRFCSENAGFIGERHRLIAARHAFGDVTRSDRALAQARLALARSHHIAAAGLEQSRAIYQQTIGDKPANLAPPAPVDPEA